MSSRANKLFAYWLVLTAALVLLAACSQASPGATVANGDNGTADTRAPAAHVLTYYIDQMGQDPQNVIALMNYEAALELCRQGGAVVTPLSSADVAKIGVRHLRVWQRPGENVMQIDTWSPMSSTQGEPGPIKLACHFNGLQKHTIREVRIQPDELYVLNLTKRTGTYEVASKFSVGHGPIPIALGAHFLDELKAAGFEKLGLSQALGQPCQLWKGSDAQGVPAHGSLTVGGAYTECDWAGGAKWGVGARTPGAGSVTRFVLWRKMDRDIPQHPGWVKTTEFDVGHLPAGSDHIFEIPQNVTIRSKTAGVPVPRSSP